MAIIYHENVGKFDYGRFKVMELSATKIWCNHLDNYFYLRFIFENSDNRSERWQANKEMQVAERKMIFWEKSKEFNRDRAEAYREKLKKTWNLSNNNASVVYDEHVKN